MRYQPGRDEKPSLRAHQARCIDSDDELVDSNTVEIIGSAGNRKKRKDGCTVKSKPWVEGAGVWSSEEARDPPEATTITRDRYQGKSTLPKQKTQKRRFHHQGGIASANKARNSSARDKKKRCEDAGNIQKTNLTNCDGDDLCRRLLKPSSTRLESPRCPQSRDGVKDFSHGMFKVEDELNLSPRAFRTASEMLNPEKDPSTSTSSWSSFNSWFSWPFKNQMILIDLTSSREKISPNHESLDSDVEYCSIHECGERLGLMLPQKKVKRKQRASRRSSASSQSIHNISRSDSEIDELLDKLVDRPLTRLTDRLDSMLDYISFSMCHHVLYTIKNSNNTYRLRESSSSTNSIS